MHHGRVVLVTKLPPDFRQRCFGQLLCQKHRNLPRDHDCTRIVLLLELCHTHAEMLSHHPLNRLDGNLAHLRINELLQALLRRRQRDFKPMHPGPGNQTRQSAFKFANIRPHMRSNKQCDFRR